jgi:hypothetical protein
MAVKPTVALGWGGWQSRIQARRFLHEFNGVEQTCVESIVFVGQRVTVIFVDLVKQQSSELCSSACCIN